ncbi:MAG: cobyrinate a,c-diamide synthase [Ignavibacteriaceae bacterium]|nr:cobyrinate a,c-diamide synthase [Ignavibacteriaceae bacterium]
MNNKLPAFLLAAPSSGSGKTTLSLALLRIFAERGLRVQPFKCGPDYLDTMLHTRAAAKGGEGLSGINLDTFMAGEAHVRNVFARKSAEADAVVVEGVMGLFDGAVKADGSSASIAKLLDLPVVLVVDAKGVAYSVAPLLYGFKHFDPDVRIAGVIFNRVNSEAHYRFLKDACLDVGVEPLGYVPRNDAMSLPERYLGLNIDAGAGQEAAFVAMAEHVRKTLDIKRLLEIVTVDVSGAAAPLLPVRGKGNAVVAVARDEAFNFLYAENLDVLREYGSIEYFSPLDDARLPGADMIYLAGGYPELYAGKLSDNLAMRREMLDFATKGGVIYAECGGMMYLGRSMTDHEGNRFPMCGVFDMDTSMQEAGLHLGYRKVRLNDPAYGGELRGHEFHYSAITRKGALNNVASIASARNKPVDTALFRFRNTFASYIHLYWGETRDFPGYLLSRGGIASARSGL